MSQPITVYAELQEAFEHFNRSLFDSALPVCMITLQRERNTFGYFSRQRFYQNETGEIVDEIAMNPAYFAIRSIRETLSTLVHEMVHMWQECHGSPGRRRYHNKEWADKMESLGLMPSSTGQEGGRRVGDTVSHYIICSGAFDRCCDALITEEYRLTWYDRFPAQRPPRAPAPSATGPDNQGLDQEEATSQPIEDDVLVFPRDDSEKNRSNREKYRCPVCGIQVWGKPGLRVLCGGEECDAAELQAV